MLSRCHGAVDRPPLRGREEAATAAVMVVEEIAAGTISSRKSCTGKRNRTDTVWPQVMISTQTRTGTILMAISGQAAGRRVVGNRKGARRGNSSGGATRLRQAGLPEVAVAGEEAGVSGSRTISTDGMQL